MVNTAGYKVNTIFAPRVEGSAPPGYDPNASCPKVRIDFQGVFHEFDMEELRQLDLYRKSADERYRILSEYLLRRNSGSKEIKMETDKKSQVAQVNKVESIISDVTPKIGVKFRFPQFPIKLISYYHRVILTRDYLILVYDTRAVGLQRVELPEDCEVYITIPEYKINDILAANLGISFVDMDMEYTVFRLLGKEVNLDSLEEEEFEKEVKNLKSKIIDKSEQESKDE